MMKLETLIEQQRKLVDVVQNSMLEGKLTELDNGSVVLQRVIDKLATLQTTAVMYPLKDGGNERMDREATAA